MDCAMTQVYLEGVAGGMVIDHDCVYFADMGEVPDSDVKFEGDRVRVRGQLPSIMRASFFKYGKLVRTTFGDTMWARKSVLRALGYEATRFLIDPDHLPVVFLCTLLVIAIVAGTIRLVV